MKSLQTIPALIAVALACPAWASAADVELSKGHWTALYSDSQHTLTLSYDGAEVFKKVGANTVYTKGDMTDVELRSDNLTPVVTIEDITDIFGNGKSLNLAYSDGTVTMTQSLSFYDDRDYFIANLSLEALDGSTVASNHMVPFCIGDYVTPFTSTNNRVLWVPFDNDGHVAYDSFALRATSSVDCESHEVSCVYNTDDRFGLVAGAVDHDNWKNGVNISGIYLNRVTKFECLSGMSNYFTRDVLPHGKVRGNKVNSARFMVGAFADWREGMNSFAEANTVVEPPVEWISGNPVGWSSYGSQQEYVSYEGVVESARFMKDELFPLGFYDRNGQITISLDACGEDNIPATRLVNMSKNIFGNGTTYTYDGQKYDGMDMILGLYGGPFVIWEWSLGSKVPGTGLNGAPDYTFSDMALKVNGEYYKVPSNGAYASDPTHPAMACLIEQAFKNYNARGAKYVKIDFMNCGQIQGDSYYNPEITTAVQAYNYAMKMVREQAEKYDMYLVMAMSPAFPYHYVQGRRTCCDRFSKISESEYVMNATSYGWWMDKLYPVCDPDQLVMCQNNYGAKETDGENRVRATTGMTTGAFIFGDNFSEKVVDKNTGEVRGYPEEARSRAKSIMGNEEINRYVREHTGAFMPVEGKGEYTNPNTCETAFVRHCDDATYVAVFNYSILLTSRGKLDFERLGINGSDVASIKELWFGSDIDFDTDGFSYEVPTRDVRVYRIFNEQQAGVESIDADRVEDMFEVILTHTGGACNVKSSKSLRTVNVYGIDGSLLGHTTTSLDCDNELSLPVSCAPRVAIVEAIFTDGTRSVRKAAR